MVADIIRYLALSLSRPRQCDKTLHRATERQNAHHSRTVQRFVQRFFRTVQRFVALSHCVAFSNCIKEAGSANLL